MRYLVVAFVLVFSSVSAESFKVGNLTVSEAFAYPTNGKSGAGYFTLKNDGAEDVLIGVSGDFPRVMVHESIMKNGVMKMKHRMKVKIPSEDIFEFKPGGYHVMFMGLSEDWNVMDEIEVTLKFKTAGQLDVRLLVIPRP